jgi:hypothetical protein
MSPTASTEVADLLEAWHASFGAGDADGFAAITSCGDPDGAWRVTLLIHSHSHPMEPLA